MRAPRGVLVFFALEDFARVLDFERRARVRSEKE